MKDLQRIEEEQWEQGILICLIDIPDIHSLDVIFIQMEKICAKICINNHIMKTTVSDTCE